MRWLTGHQPNYLPYPGLFSKILRADAFVLVDHVQFRKQSHHMRNTICTNQGPLTISLKTRAPYQARICDVQLVEPEQVLREHWTAIRMSYGKYPHFKEFGPPLEEIYRRPWTMLADLNEAIIRYLLSALGIGMPVCKSSEILKDWSLRNNDMIIAMCETLGCGGFISGMGAIDYIDEEKFSASGLVHRFDSYVPIEYETPRGRSTPNMSVADPLFAIGPEATVELLRRQQQDAAAAALSKA